MLGLLTTLRTGANADNGHAAGETNANDLLMIIIINNVWEISLSIGSAFGVDDTSECRIRGIVAQGRGMGVSDQCRCCIKENSEDVCDAAFIA